MFLNEKKNMVYSERKVNKVYTFKEKKRISK